MSHTHLLSSMENLGIYHILCFLLLCVFPVLMKFLHRVWWRPMHIKHVFLSQGIKGPPCTFFRGNTGEISKMIRENTMTRTTHEYISHDLFPVVQPHIYSWIKLYGKNFLYWDGFEAELVVTEPELIKEMLNDRGRYFSFPEFDQYLKKIVGGGILQAEGEKWVKLRKLSNQAFHSESLRNMIPAVVESVEMMLRRWKNDNVKEVDVSEEFRVLTAEAISRAAFGSSYLEGGEIFPMLRKLVILSGKNAYKIRLPIIGKFLKEEDVIESEKLEKRTRDCMLEIVKKRERLFKTGEIDGYGEDFLGLLLKAHYDSNENVKLSIEEVLDECKTFYSAGHGSTSVLLSWTIFLLAIHTDWQERAREEVHYLFGQQPPNPDGMSRLKIVCKP